MKVISKSLWRNWIDEIIYSDIYLNTYIVFTIFLHALGYQGTNGRSDGNIEVTVI